MSLLDRNNPYKFDEFLEWRKGVDYYRDDPFFQKVVKYYTKDKWPKIHEAAEAFSAKASFRWRDLAEAAAVPEKRPYMTHYDGHGHRIDRIVYPMETLVMEKDIFSEGLFANKISAWEKLVKMFLIYQNGEACVFCPLTCTDGLIALLERYADSPELKRILAHCRDGIDGEFAIGAQFLSEIQGGSDVPANLLEVVQERDTWRLYGDKFFCSAAHADYAVVTAKPQGSEKVALFVVPAWLPGNKEKEIRNGYTINRIKWKMGTSELITAELTFDGAVAYPVGPLDRGVANVVGIVLTHSRLAVGLTSGAFMTRVLREAKAYSKFRSAFGKNINRFPMVVGQLAVLERQVRRTIAGCFKLYDMFFRLECGLEKGLDSDEPVATKQKRFAVRELVMLQKITVAFDCTDVVRMAMSIFGGHGVMEDFSSLPRLYRDAAINELWEGPRNVLLTQIHRDFQRAADWYAPSALVADILKGSDPALIHELGEELTALVAVEGLYQMDEKTIGICGKWDRLCNRLCHAFQEAALAEVENGQSAQ